MIRESVQNDKSALDLILHNFDKPVFVILNENNEINIVKGKIEVWAVYNELEKTYPTMPKLTKTDMLYIMQFCINNNLGLKLNGIVENIEFVFDIDELLKVENIISTTTWIIKHLKNEIDEKTLISKISDIEVYFIGNFPNSGLKGEQFGVITLKAIDGDKDMIPVFLMQKDSVKFNPENHLVTKTKLKYIMHFYNIFNIILEPDKKHWVLLHP